MKEDNVEEQKTKEGGKRYVIDMWDPLDDKWGPLSNASNSLKVIHSLLTPNQTKARDGPITLNQTLNGTIPS